MKRNLWRRMDQNPPYNARESGCETWSILHHEFRFMSHSPSFLWWQTRQNGLQNNWLLRAYIANIQEIKQHFQVFKAFPTQKTTTKCVTKSPRNLEIFLSVRAGHPKVTKYQRWFPSQKTATKCVAVQNFSKSQKSQNFSKCQSLPSRSYQVSDG